MNFSFGLNAQVAQFLRVNPETGLFFFDSSYRPVPLAQQYIGISEQNFSVRNELLNEICYKKVFVSIWNLSLSLSLTRTLYLSFFSFFFSTKKIIYQKSTKWVPPIQTW